VAAEAEVQRCIGVLMQLARDLVDGVVTPEELEGPAVEQCRALFANVAGPGDVLWDVQVGVARKVVALGGMSYDEICEWASVLAPAEESVTDQVVVDA